jgi:hypothetical protein
MPVAAIALMLAIPAARAAEAPAPIRVSVPACPTYPFAVEAFLGSLEVELAGQVPPCCLLAAPGTPAATSGGGAGPLVTMGIEPCGAAATSVSVHLHDPARAMDADRRVELGDIPGEARPRALALAVAEMVHALFAAPPPPAPPAAPPLPEARPGARLPRLFLTGVLEVESHPGNNMALLGLGGSAAVARGRWMAALDLQWMVADPLVDLGDVRTQLAAGALTAGPRFSVKRSILDLGATARFGWAWMSGHATGAGVTTGSGSAPVASVGARLGIFLPTQAGVSHLRAMLEGGAMLRGLDATVNGATAASLSGGYLLIGLGFGENR